MSAAGIVDFPVRPGEDPAWDPAEGMKIDAEGRAIGAKWSGPFEPATVSCLRLGLPSEDDPT